MGKKPKTQSTTSRRPPKPPKKTGTGLVPGSGGGHFGSIQPTRHGAIASYVHAGARIGVMVEISCDTDFVARTDDFLNLARELCFQVAATKPIWLKRDEVPPSLLEEKRKEFEQQIPRGKTGNEATKFVENRLENYLSDVCLLEQAYIREPSGRMNVGVLLTEATAKSKETVQIRRFIRWEVGKA